MRAPVFENNDWLYLGAAADFLGVHFTTLRRWTNEGKIPCSRTPGGRRRYRLSDLAAFLRSLEHGKSPEWDQESRLRAALVPPQQIGITLKPWSSRFSDTERSTMRSEGQQLMAVLMQYATRHSGGEAFLEEGERLAGVYGQMSCHAGLTLNDTMRAFLLVRRSISDSLHGAGAMAGVPDADTHRLYDRVTTFLDVVLLATVDGYEQALLRTLAATSEAGGRNQ
jgi:excisionase family DNA binding protein